MRRTISLLAILTDSNMVRLILGGHSKERSIAMSHRIAHMKPSDFSLGQVNEFIAAFGRFGGNPALLQILIENNARMASMVALARGEELPKGYALASLVLGADFISPEEVAAVYNFSYSKQQLRHFAETLPDEKTLQWLRTNGFMLIPGPDRRLPFNAICDLNQDLFELEYSNIGTLGSFVITIPDGDWLLLRKCAVPGSDCKSMSEQEKLLTTSEQVPNLAQVCYGLGTMYRVRNIKLLPNSCVRTSTPSPVCDHHSVCIGNFWGHKISILSLQANHPREGLGIASVLAVK